MQVRYQTALLPEILSCHSPFSVATGGVYTHFLGLSTTFLHDKIIFAMKKVKTAVVGASGYTGQELLRIFTKRWFSYKTRYIHR